MFNIIGGFIAPIKEIIMLSEKASKICEDSAFKATVGGSSEFTLGSKTAKRFDMSEDDLQKAAQELVMQGYAYWKHDFAPLNKVGGEGTVINVNIGEPGGSVSKPVMFGSSSDHDSHDDEDDKEEMDASEKRKEEDRDEGDGKKTGLLDRLGAMLKPGEDKPGEPVEGFRENDAMGKEIHKGEFNAAVAGFPTKDGVELTKPTKVSGTAGTSNKKSKDTAEAYKDDKVTVKVNHPGAAAYGATNARFMGQTKNMSAGVHGVRVPASQVGAFYRNSGSNAIISTGLAPRDKNGNVVAADGEEQNISHPKRT